MLELFDAARSRLARTGFDAGRQTRIAAFVAAAHQINGTLLGDAAWQPISHAAQVHLHSQLFREVESATLLARVTRWSADPWLHAEAQQLTAPLWWAWTQCRLLQGLAPGPRATFKALALGHALLAQVRLSPLIPAQADETDPFILALRRIDADNGRLIQLQLRWLQHAAGSLADAEAVIEHAQRCVSGAFGGLLATLARP